jgi:hypothetical protein
MMKKWWFLTLAACVGLLGATSLAEATILGPVESASPPSQDGTLGPPNVTAVATTPFSIGGGAATGTYREFVSSGRPGSPFTGLSFEYQITVAATSEEAVPRFTADGFAGWLTNVTFAPLGTVKTSEADRSANGDVMGFTLEMGGVQPGQTSMWMIVDTNAPSFTPNLVFMMLPSHAEGFSGAAVGPAAPEPGTLTLALVGLFLAGGFGYRRLCRRNVQS